MTNATLIHEAGHSKSVLWNNPEACSGDEGRRGVQDGGYTGAPVVDSC